MSFSAFDHACMARALQLAERGLYTTRPNPRVGCVVARDQTIVGEGFHREAGGPHAEIFALRAAGENARGATAYVTLEPCSHHGRTPPCADALIQAGVKRVVAATRDPNPRVAGAGLARLATAGIEVETGLLETEARRLNPGFIKRMETGRPWVRVKLAMSLDGRTAMASGESQWITGAAARHDVQRWRARSCAILTGSGTVRTDDPSLNLRVDREALECEVEPRQPLRVLLDTNDSINSSSKLFNIDGKILIINSKTIRKVNSQVGFSQVERITVGTGPHGLALGEVLAELGRREINEVHVEAGATLSGALLGEGLLDELLLYVAPHLMGDGARGLFHLPQLQQMDQRISLQIVDIRSVGADWRIIAYPVQN
ncbi:MAG: bifunctional diaminohydroxyphosphoribosylaminopyrimidine deaminase/5-amino-6-(5-phosphoribosylamino)uracil reductase RibD [Thiotrichales bacterium]